MKNRINTVAEMMETAKANNAQRSLPDDTLKIDLSKIALPTDLATDATGIVAEVKAMVLSAKEISTKAQFIRAKSETLCKSLRAQIEVKQVELAAMTDMNSPEVAAKAAEIETLDRLRRAMDEVSWRAGDAVWSLSIEQRVSEIAQFIQ